MRPRFKKAYVEVTSICNLQCAFCPPTRRPARSMSVPEFHRVVTELQPLTRHIHLHVKGEPLLHPDLEGLLDESHAAAMRVHLVTNGTLLGDRADLLLHHPAVHQVNVSLHSFDGDAAEDYLAPLVDFARRAERGARLVTVLRFWSTPDPALLAGLEAALPRVGKALGQRTFLDFDTEFIWPRLSDDDGPARAFCLGLRDQVAILVDGTVVPCCLDGEGVMALGNVFEQPLADILASPRAQALYRGFTEHRCSEPLCRKCRFRERFTP